MLPHQYFPTYLTFLEGTVVNSKGSSHRFLDLRSFPDCLASLIAWPARIFQLQSTVQINLGVPVVLRSRNINALMIC